MGVTKVTFRKRLLPSGKITLYLDFYPPLRDPHTRKYVRHEYLGIYLVNKPKFPSDKDANKEKIAQAEAIRSGANWPSSAASTTSWTRPN